MAKGKGINSGPFSAIGSFHPPSAQEPDRVRVSKEAFDRAFRCKAFLEGVPDAVLALKGINDIVTLCVIMLRHFLDRSDEAAAHVQSMEMLFDEIKEQYALEQGESKGYARRTTLVNVLRAASGQLNLHHRDGVAIFAQPPKLVVEINRLLPDVCSKCSGQCGIPVPSHTDKRGNTVYLPGIDVDWCPQCKGFGFTNPHNIDEEGM